MGTTVPPMGAQSPENKPEISRELGAEKKNRATATRSLKSSDLESFRPNPFPTRLETSKHYKYNPKDHFSRENSSS